MAKKSKKTDTSSKSTVGAVEKTIADNRKARYRFEILEQVECGLLLLGSEVKSLREGNISLEEAYGRVREGELWLLGCDIPEYRQTTHWNHEPKRPRKLLVQKRQFAQLAARAHERGLTLVPLRLYFSARGIAKVLLAVCKGKKLHDKRESIKEADSKRRIDRSLRRNRS